jgi:hypothetical protein
MPSMSKRSTYLYEVSSKGVSETFNLLLVDSIKLDNIIKGGGYDQGNLNISKGGLTTTFILDLETAEMFYETLTNAWEIITDRTYPEADLSNFQ